MSSLFIVYDSKAKTYSDVMCSEDELSIQQFVSVLVNTHSELPQHKFPEDFVLYKLANVKDANIYLFDEKEFVCSLVGLKRKCPICESELEVSEE